MEAERTLISRSLESTSSRIAVFADHLSRVKANAQRSNPDLSSPFILHSIYEATVSQDRPWEQTNPPQCKTNMDSLREILGGFGARWQIGDVYVEAFESMSETWPSLLYFMGGRQLSVMMLSELFKVVI